MSDETRTRIDKAGREVWPDGTPVSTNNAFRVGYGGAGIDVQSMAASATSSRNTSRLVSERVARGENPGKVYGMSRKGEQRLRDVKPAAPIAYTKAQRAPKRDDWDNVLIGDE